MRVPLRVEEAVQAAKPITITNDLETTLKILATALVLGLAATAASAQSSVTLFGSIDEGIDYLTNAGGSRLWAANAGKRSPDRIGFRGQEDLGGGTSAFFRIETGFNSDAGTQSNATTFWNRFAGVGVQHKTLGSVSLGRMPDFMYEYVPPANNAQPGISAAFSVGNLDGLANQFPINNAVKYETPIWGGFQFGAMNGFGEVVNSFNTNRAYSLGAKYADGPLRIVSSWNVYNNRTVDVRGLFGYTSLLGQAIPAGGLFNANHYRTWGLGGTYTVGLFTPNLLVTDVKFDNAVGSASVRNYHAGLAMDVSGGKKVDVARVSYSRTHFLDEHFNQYNVFFSHNLSLRTQVYSGVSLQKAQGALAKAGFTGYTKSSSDAQTIVRIGVWHLF
jgi:predicted porin